MKKDGYRLQSTEGSGRERNKRNVKARQFAE